ncbi:MAG TPA: glycoside hydrolase family 38 C-terminal domain-containing protein [Stellaceae bacterium]
MPDQIPAGTRSLAETEQAIRDAVYTPVAQLSAGAWVAPEPVPFAERRQARKVVLRPGQRWSKATFDCAWFHFTGTVPASAAGKEVVLLIDLNGEGCVVDEEGRPVLGLTSVSSGFSREYGEPGKRVVPFRAAAEGGEPIDLWVEAGANDLFGVRRGDGTLQQAAIAIRNPTLWALQYDFSVLHELARHLPDESPRKPRLSDALGRAAAALRDFTEDEATLARAALAPELGMPSDNRSLTVMAAGHAHMDLAWLWPIRETIRKCGRTFATVLQLMQRYPDYVFGASQPQQYEWVKQRYPELYQQMKRRIAEGRWEAQGAMWVEPDINLPTGESLIRQILYGKRFFREEFGKDPVCLWEPDVFGYSGSLPQLLVKSGVKYFMTQKLSWNWVTRHPHHTFWWQGIDGSRVLAHMPPEDTYNSAGGPEALLAAEQKFIDGAVSDACLMLFGIGDGGGGPGEEHLERLAREKNLDGLPPVVQAPAEQFFMHIERDADRYATWAGELYLERHQGTYTTQGQVKRHNRKLELALRELELTAALAAELSGVPYPGDRLERIWKEVLLYQFHDILPGSSITRVYDEALPRYEALSREVAEMTSAAETALFGAGNAGDTAGRVAVRNSLSWERSEWLKLGGKWLKPNVPPMGYAVIEAAAAAAPTPFEGPTASPSVLENGKLRLVFDKQGAILSCFDKEHGREALASGNPGNVLAVYRDTGDAWDIPMDYRDRPPRRFRLQSVEAVVDGPRALLRHRYRFGKSRLDQEVVLLAGSRRVDFVTTVDWRESGSMLRTSFIPAVTAREASCDIQFGSIRRPTHTDTPRDFAKFEICAHKWVDISDGSYGLALLNDCKYGHRVHGNVLDLNLLRSPHYPDPVADRGEHRFTYSLHPHAGDHVSGGVIRAGYELNIPMRVLAGVPADGPLGTSGSWFRVSASNVIIETVKQAEDGKGLVVRLYEAAGAGTRAELFFGFVIDAAEETNLIEENPVPLRVSGNALALDFGPFEIRTVRLVPRR